MWASRSCPKVNGDRRWTLNAAPSPPVPFPIYLKEESGTLFSKSLHGATVLAALTYPEEPWMKQHSSWESCDRVRRNGTFCPCWCGRFLNVHPWVCVCVPTWGSHLSRDPVLLINLVVLDNFENMLMMSKVIVRICLKSQQRYIKCTTSFGLI